MSDETTNNRAFSVTLKAGKGYDAPWIVIQGETATEVHDRVLAVAESSLGATVGQAAKAFSAAYEFGHKLGAEPLNPPAEEEKKEAPAKKAPAKKAPAKKAAPEEEAPEGPEAPAEEAVEEPAPEKPAAARTKPPAKKWKRA